MQKLILALSLSSLLGIATATVNATPTAQHPEETLNKGRAFLEENAKKPSVIRLPSGLEYEILVEGDSAGPSPGPTDFVTVNYRGTLIDGREFDSSYARNQPATFAVNAVIPGWTEALQLMKPKSKWRIVIPSELAYGTNGAGSLIPPDSTLIFEIELLDLKSALDEEANGLNPTGEEEG